MLIQVDVDSTLYDADRLFAQLAKEAGIKWIRNSDHWFLPEDVGCTVQDLKNIFRKAHSHEYVSQQKPYKNAASTLFDLVERFPDVEIAYVSDRNEAQSAALREWLQANDFLHSDDQHVVVSKDKRDWMRENRPDIVIDDRVRTLLMARFELEAIGVSLAHKHNINLKREVDGIYICDNWLEIGDLLSSELIPELIFSTVR